MKTINNFIAFCEISNPNVLLPVPGNKQLQIRQNQAKHSGSTGSAALISDDRSTNDSSKRGLGSSGGIVGAILCFLLFILVRRLSAVDFFRQHRIALHRREQHPLNGCKINNQFCPKTIITVYICSIHKTNLLGGRFSGETLSARLCPGHAASWLLSKARTTSDWLIVMVRLALNLVRFSTAEHFAQTKGTFAALLFCFGRRRLNHWLGGCRGLIFQIFLRSFAATPAGRFFCIHLRFHTHYRVRLCIIITVLFHFLRSLATRQIFQSTTGQTKHWSITRRTAFT